MKIEVVDLYSNSCLTKIKQLTLKKPEKNFFKYPSLISEYKINEQIKTVIFL